LLNFPYAYGLAGGWRISLIMQVLVLLLSICGLHFLAKAAKEKNVSSYQDTVREVVGVRFGIMSMTFIMLYTFGCCITFQIVLGDQLDLVFEQIFSNTNVWYLDRRFTITVIGFASILPLCIPKGDINKENK
jgi:sodium-coupled neutral amino acid transporter 7/8